MLTRNVVSLASGNIRNFSELHHRQRGAGQEREQQESQEGAAPTRPVEQRRQEVAKRAHPSRRAEPFLRFLVAQQRVRRPGRDREGDPERCEHRDRDVQGNRPHVRAHHAGHEEHRQEREHDGERRERGRASDLAHRAHRRLGFRPAGVERVVAVDVFDQHDRVVDEQSEREDQREEGDAVDGLSGQHPDAEGDEQGQRDRGRHHERFAPAEGHQQDDDDQDRFERAVRSAR